MLDLSGAQGWYVLITQRQGTGEEEHLAAAAVGWYSVSWQQADPWAPRYEKCSRDGRAWGGDGGGMRGTGWELKVLKTTAFPAVLDLTPLGGGSDTGQGLVGPGSAWLWVGE